MYVSSTKSILSSLHAFSNISGLHFTTLPTVMYLHIVAVICGKTAITWFAASTNRRHSAFSIPHFTFRIPRPAIPHFTHSLVQELLIKVGAYGTSSAAVCNDFSQVIFSQQ